MPPAADATKAIVFAEQTLAVLTAALLAFVLLMEAAMPLAIVVLAPGFVEDRSFGLAVEFSRLTFPYLLFISLTALQGGVFNAFGRFAAPAATPILLNLSLITALLGTGPLMPTMGHALAWGVVAAGIIQFLWLLGSCGREGRVAADAMAAADAGGASAAPQGVAGGLRRRRLPGEHHGRHRPRFVAAGRLGLLPLLRRPAQPAPLRHHRRRRQHRAAAAALPPGADRRRRRGACTARIGRWNSPSS